MPKIYDSLTASHLLNENLMENGLKYLTRTQLHREVTEYKDAVKYGTDSKEFYTYAMEDAVNTFDLYNIQSPQIAKQGLGHLAWDIEFPFQRALMHLAINGIAADSKAAKKMKEEVQHLYYQIEDEMLKMFDKKYETGITPRGRKVWCEPQINMNSGPQIAKSLQSLGIKLTEKTVKGKIATTNKVLEKLKNDIERRLR